MFIADQFFINFNDTLERVDQLNATAVEFAKGIESTRENCIKTRDGLTSAMRSFSDILSDNLVR